MEGRSEVMKVKSEMCSPMQVILEESSKERFAKLIVELVREDRDLRKAILEVALSSPNVVTEI